MSARQMEARKSAAMGIAVLAIIVGNFIYDKINAVDVVTEASMVNATWWQSLGVAYTGANVIVIWLFVLLFIIAIVWLAYKLIMEPLRKPY